MDREEEEVEKLQFMGLFEIYKESFKIIFSLPKIFSKITIALILPLAFNLLAQIQLSELMVSKKIHNQKTLNFTHSGTPTYHRLTHQSLFEYVAFLFSHAAYLLFLIIFYLLSTSAVVYSMASIYTSKEPTFKKIMAVVPKVLDRLMSTFVWSFIIVFIFNVVALVFIRGITGDTARLIFTLVLNLNGVVHISFVWHLASVISVLEDFKGIEAMIKSKALMKGKMRVALSIFLELTFTLVLIQFGFEKMVVNGEKLGMWIRVLSGIVCLLLLMQLLLLGLVVQTVFYFVCKSYHHESIDKSLLVDHPGDKIIPVEQYDV